MNSVAILFCLIVLAVVFELSIRKCKETERLVLFRFRKLIGILGPGKVIVLPFIDNSHRISLNDCGDSVSESSARFKDIVIPVSFEKDISIGWTVRIVRFETTPGNWTKVEVS